MPPLIAAVASVFVAIGVGATTAAFIATALVNITLFAGLTLLRSAFAPKNNAAASQFGQSQTVSLDATDPRRIIFGQYGTAGALTTFQTWGTNNEYLVLIFRVADHKCASLDQVYWQGNLITLGSGGAVSQCYADGHDNLWITFANGDWNQAADADMIAHSGGRWTANDRGRGVAYVKVKARTNAKAFPGGLSSLFQFIFVITGYATYDRRLDSSVGGSGAQRVNDQSTWAVSKNAAVVTENFLRGIRVEDTTAPVSTRKSDTFYGLRLTDADLPFADNVAAFNSCDEAVTLLAGGTEPRYAVGGAMTCDASMTQVLTDLLNAMGSTKLLTSPGRWIIQPGVVRTSERTFTDYDQRLDGPFKYTQDIPFDTVNNAVFGRFADPAAMFTPQPLPPRTSQADEATDHGGKATTLDLPYVTSLTQGQRVQEITRRRSRCQKSAQLSYAPENLDLEAGDWISWQSDRLGWEILFEVQQGLTRTGDDDHLMVVIDFQEINSEVFDWDPSVDELSRTDPVNLASGTFMPVPVTGLTATATTIAGANGAIAALAITCDALSDPTIVAVRFEYVAHGYPAGAPQTLTKQFSINPATQVGPQAFTITDGLADGYEYDVRAAAVVTPPRDLDWTAFVTTSTPTTGLISVGFAGQGLLATQNAADFSTQVTGSAKPSDNATTNPVYNQNVDPATLGVVPNGSLWTNTATGAHYMRISGSWTLAATIAGSLAAGTVLFDSASAGSFPFTIPANSTAHVDIEGYAPGGGGGQSHGGGAGGYFKYSNFPVTPGSTVINGTIGHGGAAYDPGSSAATGGTNTSVSNPSMTAYAGGGGATAAGTAGSATGGSTNTTGEAGDTGGLHNGGANLGPAGGGRDAGSGAGYGAGGWGNASGGDTGGPGRVIITAR